MTAEELLTAWLHIPNVQPAKGLSKHDQRMIKLGWDAHVQLAPVYPKQDVGLGLNLVEATERACKEPTLLEALSWICVWESERVVKQARENAQWETCFRVCLRSVLDSYPTCQVPKPDREKVAKELCKQDNGGRDCWGVESRDNQNMYLKKADKIIIALEAH